jgi:hypothetical protein
MSEFEITYSVDMAICPAGVRYVRIDYRRVGTRRWRHVNVFPDDDQTIEGVIALADEIVEKVAS